MCSSSTFEHLLSGLGADVLDRIIASVVKAIPDVESIYVFGSRARGDDRIDSDLDLFAISPDASNPRRAMDASIDAQLELMWLRMSKDLLVEDPVSFAVRAESPHTVEASVKKEGILIYGRPQ